MLKDKFLLLILLFSGCKTFDLVDKTSIWKLVCLVDKSESLFLTPSDTILFKIENKINKTIFILKANSIRNCFYDHNSPTYIIYNWKKYSSKYEGRGTIKKESMAIGNSTICREQLDRRNQQLDQRLRAIFFEKVTITNIGDTLHIENDYGIAKVVRFRDGL